MPKWLAVLQRKSDGKFYTSTRNDEDSLEDAVSNLLSADNYPADGPYKLCAVVPYEAAVNAGYSGIMGLNAYQGWAKEALAHRDAFEGTDSWWAEDGWGQVQAAKPAGLIKGKPRLEIVQDWVSKLERDQPGELASRAWDAVRAMCKD